MAHWIPILTAPGRETTAATEALDAIVQAVVAGTQPVGRWRPARGEDKALLYGYLAAARRDTSWAKRATEELSGIIESAPTRRDALALYGGLSGLGWAVEHLPELLQTSFPADGDDAPDAEPAGDGEDDGDLLAEVDAAITLPLRRARPGPWKQDFDLIGGLVGFGVYFLERWPRPTAIEGLRLVIDHLEASAQPMKPGIAWHTGPHLLPDWQRQRCPDGYYNLGVAHGVPGVIHLLGEMVAVGVEAERAQRLLEGAVEWLLAQQRPRGSRSWFGSWVAPNESHDSRPAWCYGDLGIAAVLLQAARRVGRNDWDQFAHGLVDHCLTRSPDEGSTDEAGLCHGAAGNAHVFNRIYQAENDPRCRDAALLWFDRALALRQPGVGVGGFLAQPQRDESGQRTWAASEAFLDGAIGIALALLSGLLPIEPSWDRLLLLSDRGGFETLSPGSSLPR